MRKSGKGTVDLMSDKLKNVNFLACSLANYAKGRNGREIKYIVVHYTAGDGDSAKNNAEYFSRRSVTASAHYFVDENEVWQTVNDCDTAWHCGGNSYRHPECRNANSIGVEICSRKDADGKYYFMTDAVSNAVRLVRALMDKYGVTADRVLRHYDVTGKNCPAPFVENEGEWEKFKKSLTCAEEEVFDANDLVWELGRRGIITNKALWLAKLSSDVNCFFLAKKTVDYLAGLGV